MDVNEGILFSTCFEIGRTDGKAGQPPGLLEGKSHLKVKLGQWKEVERWPVGSGSP